VRSINISETLADEDVVLSIVSSYYTKKIKVLLFDACPAMDVSLAFLYVLFAAEKNQDFFRQNQQKKSEPKKENF